ncbi:polysaccharide deacetylase family protein [Algibacillus agarilyticus]|uniref:polysaccharide deacetylase family protein n=1 Tax=Algibacillus agarilyticus TaxID=2234133 RepID=UPI000DD00AC0|nr:polysaccharide deacetylase family protein [Algibacillus agarilyticus]
MTRSVGAWVTLVFIFSFIITPRLAMADADLPFERFLTAHHKMLLLLNETPGHDPLDNNVHAARSYYSIKHSIFDELIHLAETQSETTSKRSLLAVTTSFVNYTKNANLHRADLLAFVDLAEELLLLETEKSTPEQGLYQLRELVKSTNKSMLYFGKQYSLSMSKLGKSRGANDEWKTYINALSTRYNLKSIKKHLKSEPILHKDKTRGANLVATKKDELATVGPKIIWGNNMPDKTVVLTFDDGPHRLRTDKILNTLKTYKVNGYFFAVGKNLGKITVDANGNEIITVHKKNKKVINRILDEGHVLANHSFSHGVLTKLNNAEQNLELEKTNKLIKAVSSFENRLFRPPYGSKNSELEQNIKQQNMDAIMWNIDSLDWSDPIPESIAQRTLDILKKKQKGILLFHDIHKQTVAALPYILEGLAKEGFKVTTLDGTAFSLTNSGVPSVPEAPKPKLYSKSWAVVIGVNQYQHWPKLDYAVADASSIANKLRDDFGFKPEHIIELYDKDATRDNITEVLGHTLADPKKVGNNDRVFVFYAGHGATSQLANGGNLGYLIPVDAELNKFSVRGISMSQLNDFSALIPAKHVYFVMDSCYSGLALTRGVGAQNYNYLSHITGRSARQIITAGGADQEVADGGPNGHSVFTWAFLQALEGKADTDNNGYLTASEIGTYVSPVVASYATQTPAFGNLIGGQGGDFVFELKTVSATEINRRSIQEKAQRVAALTAVQNDLMADVSRQIDLERDHDLQTANQDNDLDAKLKSNKRVKEAYKLDAQALKLLRKNKLNEAEALWAQAVKLNPYNENIVNNYGYVLDKQGKHGDALIWYYRTVELNPRRTPIYLNLGDLMVKLNNPMMAISYYERYLHLYPSYKQAKKLRATIKALAE